MRLETVTIGAETFMVDSATAAEIGRLRIHDSQAALALARRSHYPFVPDGGCISATFALMDAAALPPHLAAGIRAMNNQKTVTLSDGQTVPVDARVAAHVQGLEGQLAALRHMAQARTAMADAGMSSPPARDPAGAWEKNRQRIEAASRHVA